ncbi:MAG TPA: DUF354 domain-containing protein [Acidimicrobiales bacterium]|nr:DUF354 domain-containing protein [Acidimicrobiales bacterium]
MWRHGGRSTAAKAAAVAQRAGQLSRWARGRRPDLALSFNSYAQAVAARMTRIPFVTVADYEYQPANHLAFRLAQRVLVPEGFDARCLRRQGARPRRVVVFGGLKEDVSLVDFTPDPGFRARLEALGIPADRLLVTMRPPATSSLYHRFANDWFYDVLRQVAQHPGTVVVVLCRYPSQAEFVRSLQLPQVVVPEEVLDGLNLVYWSDLVISAGGSMNREAVALGTPAATVFAGKMAGVDRRLIAEGALHHLVPEARVEELLVPKQPGPVPTAPGQRAIDCIVDVATEVAALSRRRRRREAR